MDRGSRSNDIYVNPHEMFSLQMLRITKGSKQKFNDVERYFGKEHRKRIFYLDIVLYYMYYITFNGNKIREVIMLVCICYFTGF